MSGAAGPSRARQAVRGVDLRAVILAGGRGTRFWPLGRLRRPKQFLPIVGRSTMVEETVERVRPLIPARAVWPVADAAQTKMLRRLLPRLPAGNFIVEPLARNTAPSLMLATARIFLDNPRAVVAVLPADHLIRDRDVFLRKLGAAAAFAAAGRHLVTFGITPTYPATGYGYIRFSREAASRKAGEVFYPVRAFKEKPNLSQAEEFLAAGDYAWNSGMFVWRADAFAEKLRAHAPDLVPAWELMLRGLERKSAKTLREAFEKAPAQSIDYALMEKAGDVAVCEADFGWSDVGAWSSLLEIWERDTGGNVLRGESLVLDAKGCLVYNPGKLTVLIGARDIIVVETDDALLVCDASQDQRVKEVVEILRKKGRTRHL